ncbi:MAG: lamin tail domain-containing protein, partial [Flavobacteriales bacterium]|nr:lamin tail domain-containing protein [Flavobacteriales bacterium]
MKSAIAQTLVINEWMSKNSTGITDEDGDFSDWVELYNGGTASVNLANYGISDNDDEPFKWIFPEVTIPPQQFLIVFCSGKDRTVLSALHTNFKLGPSDDLVLTDDLGNTLDEKEIGTTVYDISEGYVVDGMGDLTTFYQTTPGVSNLSGQLWNKLEPSHQS